jgi:flagellar biosynthetic protein FlhB
MAEQELDRSEQASPFKLHKAREQGQVPRSMDLVACVVLAAAMLYVATQGMRVLASLFALARPVLAQDALALTPERLAGLAGDLAAAAGMLLAPLFLLIPMAAVLGSIGQTGPILSIEPVRPDLQRLNPAQGLRRLLSARTLFDAARACLKLGVLVLAGVLAVQAQLPQLYAMANLPPAAFLHSLVRDIASLGLQMALALALVAVLDLAYTRHEFARKLRMSRRELRDEFKNREGDPRIRARLRELRREVLQRTRALQETRNATIVLTNPTHFAVAMRYVHGEMAAPRVVAKGAGQLAAAMRAIAARHRIVVIANPPLARRLFREAALDADLPASFHAEVARIIVWVLALQRQGAAA